LVIGAGSVVDRSSWNGHTRGGNVSCMLTPRIRKKLVRLYRQ
jgi:hypothetical protein